MGTASSRDESIVPVPAPTTEGVEPAELGKCTAPAAVAVEVERSTDEAASTKKTKTVTRRKGQAEIDRWIAITDEAFKEVRRKLVYVELLSQVLAMLPPGSREKVIEIDAMMEEERRKEREEMLEYRDDVLRQYRDKGYVEYQVEVDDGDGQGEEEGYVEYPAPPRRGRRRFRPGIVKKAGGAVRKLN